MRKLLQFLGAAAFLFFINNTAQAQKRLLQGYVHDSATGVPVINAIISNETTKKMVTPDQNGFFSITVSQGDMVFINAFNYVFDTLRATTLMPDTLHVQLSRVPELLPSVTVSTQGYTRYQLDSLRRREEFAKDMGAPKQKTISKADNMGFGVGINLSKFSNKKEKDRTKAYNTFDEGESMAYVDYRFSPKIVSDYSGLKGDSLVAFLRKYTPTEKWLRAHPNNEDIMFYVNEKLKEFKDIKE